MILILQRDLAKLNNFTFLRHIKLLMRVDISLTGIQI